MVLGPPGHLTEPPPPGPHPRHDAPQQQHEGGGGQDQGQPAGLRQGGDGHGAEVSLRVQPHPILHTYYGKVIEGGGMQKF